MIKIKIKDFLERNNKSIYWLAQKAELTYPTVYNLVNEKTKSIHFETLDKIMDVLEINSFDVILDKD